MLKRFGDRNLIWQPFQQGRRDKACQVFGKTRIKWHLYSQVLLGADPSRSSTG